LLFLLLDGIAWKHWPDTCECITRTIEFWNRWIRLLYCYRV